MDLLVDDVGSYPLPPTMNRLSFNEAYVLAREAVVSKKFSSQNGSLLDGFRRVVVDSFKQKCATGLDVVSYPQHYSMYEQFSNPINEAMSEGTYVVEEKKAIMPELHVIDEEAKQLSEEVGMGRILLRVCITGPMELYLKEVGTTPYMDILLMFAETVRRFAENAILNSKYVRTEVISIDEPSFGFQDISTNRDTVLSVLEKAFDFGDVTKQIHLHSSTRAADLLEVNNLDVLSFEFAASPKNIEWVSKKMLDSADKQIRVGVARTDINSILAELTDKGIMKPDVGQIAESEERIRKRFIAAKSKFGDRLTFTGPDCGLGGWPSQEAAQLLLARTVGAVRNAGFKSA
jgi:5-methyltetrahydropteroyltriglutamate--homocysteine methyltransferase